MWMSWTIVDEMNEMNCGLNEIRWNLNNEDDNVTCREVPSLKALYFDHMSNMRSHDNFKILYLLFHKASGQ